jgi:hypothetical protein
MKNIVTNLTDSVDNDRAGLISLEALKQVTAQLPPVRSASRITVGSCYPPTPQERVRRLASKREVVAR